MTYSWTIAEPPPAAWLEQFQHVPKLMQLVLWQRNLKEQSEVDAFLQPDYSSLADPFLFQQMHVAIDRIVSAIHLHEPILIYGDYDADGVTSTVIMVETLQALGANVQWYLPERLSEGYGLHTKAVERFAAQGIKLLITVDCGTSNVEEIQRAKELGLDVIVLDHHHQPATLPPADAIINPVFDDEQYPFRGFSSAGVAFTLVRALLQETELGRKVGAQLSSGWEKWLLDLVAISTVADMMPLRGENRILVRYGLMVLRKTRRPGLRALFTTMGSALDRADEYTIGFMVAPRLNAAGRLHHASMAVELLLTSDARRARDLAEQMHAINQDRQRLTELAVAEALEQVDPTTDRSAAAVFAPHWSPGILGLVAGRLAERLWRPVVVMTENDGQIVGSGRSVPSVDIMAIMDEGREHFRRYGGHPGACGFTLVSVEQQSQFSDWFRQRLVGTWNPDETAKTLRIDGTISTDDIRPEGLDALETLGPYGIEHPRPVFGLMNVTLDAVATVGRDQHHLRVTVRDGHQRLRCIGFRLGNRVEEFHVGQRVDVAIELSWNVWQGRREPQLRILDLRPSV